MIAVTDARFSRTLALASGLPVVWDRRREVGPCDYEWVEAAVTILPVCDPERSLTNFLLADSPDDDAALPAEQERWGAEA